MEILVQIRGRTVGSLDIGTDAGIDSDTGIQDMNTVMILYYIVTEQLYTQSS